MMKNILALGQDSVNITYYYSSFILIFQNCNINLHPKVSSFYFFIYLFRLIKLYWYVRNKFCMATISQNIHAIICKHWQLIKKYNYTSLFLTEIKTNSFANFLKICNLICISFDIASGPSTMTCLL